MKRYKLCADIMCTIYYSFLFIIAFLFSLFVSVTSRKGEIWAMEGQTGARKE
jgi:hypothetical protein